MVKCIGVTRDTDCQDVLESVNTLLKEHKTAAVKVEADSTNRFDARALCLSV